MLHGSMKYYPSGRKKKYNAWTTKKREYEFKEYVPTEGYRRGGTDHIPSHMGTGHACGRTDTPAYTGTLIKGISTMHKSNAVPITSEQDAKDHANMRR